MENKKTVKPLPAIFIGKKITTERVERYLKNKHPLLSNAISQNGHPKEDTKSIWYSKEHIETWLDEINIMNADGMRVYFGEYGEKDGLFAGQLCLLIVPTRLTNSGRHEDIIVENEPDFAERLPAQARSLGNTNFDAESLHRGYNYGAPCPPIC